MRLQHSYGTCLWGLVCFTPDARRSKMAGVACKLLAALDRDPVLRCPRSVVLRAEHARSAYGVSWLAARRRWRDGNARLVLQPVVRPFGYSWYRSITQSITSASDRVRPLANRSHHSGSIEPEILFASEIMMEYTHENIFIHMGHTTHD